MQNLAGRAALFFGPQKPLEIREFPLPEIAPADTLVRVLRTNVCGSDVHAWAGDFDIPSLGGKLPTILGHEACGQIVALGDSAKVDSSGAALSIGDRVVFSHFTECGACHYCLVGRSEACQRRWMAMTDCAMEAPHFVGMFADYYYVRRGSVLLRVPDDLPDSVVAGANCALAQVVSAFDQAGLAPGSAVAIQGAGGLGLYAVAVARERGASPIIVVDRVPRRLSLAKEFGADEIINLEELSTVKERIQRIRALTQQRGADFVLEVAGVAAAVSEGLSYVAPTGTYILIGNVAAGQRVEIDPARIVLRNVRIVGSCFYRPRALMEAINFLHRNHRRVPFEKLNAQTYSLENIGAAFLEAQERGLTARPSILMST